ncbi:AAA family ATPase [Winogradskyella sp.]|uniref:AAA family ATPase n=1 Tax=Winogradskyella sp. TaxID=1883156 RepID=UPI002635984A|nr:AAA family ATPase [Winogradskyella sp.]
MKFKQVEVSAFRIYNKPENSTFNFTTNTGEIADFVAIYAPNGFGKTSFYDAIEWGITNNVQRFWQNKNTQGSIDALRASNEKQVKLLRNNNAKSNIKTYVKITTDSEELTPRILKVHGKRKTDIDKAENVENRSFRQVILSQEWISSFLKEVDGERRYQLFMQNPDLVRIDNYYEGVKILYKENQKMIESLEQEITKIKLDIDPQSDYNPLETINSQITEINKELNENKVSLIELSASKEEIKDFRDLISSRVISHDKEKSLNEILSQIKKIKIGDSNIVGIEAFYSLKKDLEEINKRIKETQSNLQKFLDLQKAQNKLANEKKNIADLIKQESEHKKVLKSYDYYNTVKEKIEEKTKQGKSIEKDQFVLETKIEDLTNQESTITNRIESLIKQKLDLEEKEKDLPSLESRASHLDKEKSKFEKLNEKNKLEIEKLSSKINSIEDEINELEKVKIETNNCDYSLLLIHDQSDLIDLTNELIKANDDKRNLELKVKELNEQINQQKSLNTTIEEFINAGLNIVNDVQDSKCPLCEHQYNSYKELISRISNNKALNNILKELLLNKNKIREEINKKTKKINEGNRKLIKFYDQKINKLNKGKEVLEEKLDSLNKSQRKIIEKLKSLKNEAEEIGIKLNGLTINEYKKQLKDSLSKVSTEIDSLNKKLSEIKKELSKLKNMHRNNVAKLDFIKAENQNLEKGEKYVSVLEWLTNNIASENSTKVDLQEKLTELTNRIKQLRKDILETEKLISVYEKDLSSFNQEAQLKIELSLLKNQKEVDKQIQEFKYFVKDKFSIEVDGFNQKTLIEFLGKRENELKEELKKHNKLKEGFMKLEKYAENLYPFLQSEKAKLILKKKENELSFLQKSVTPLLKVEKKNTRDYIDKRIKDFFYENLINDLYSKIDPHPDFKSVKFVADLDTGRPRLDIFVKNQENEVSLIPNLYFSQAQINVLSLSIFMASALNSDEYNCIFIDDPIQSMDSINLLSTIDLLRGLVVNENKQIILSTHDENFFNLLKKKIPKDIFKSKFLELESFGKLKKEESNDMLMA